MIGDASIELGEYEAAFAAFDHMVSIRPGAGRVRARRVRTRAAGESTPVPSTRCRWRERQPAHTIRRRRHGTERRSAELHLRMGQLADAEREYRRAEFLFPNYPFATIGQGKVQVLRGNREEALTIFLEQFRRTPTLDLAARIGDLYAQAGNTAEAERYYQLGEELAGPGIAQTEAGLALFLAERDRKLPEAVTVAEAVAAIRHDIFTQDALAWAYYKTGQLDKAFAASERALRTGTRDERILAHAAAIRAGH